MLPLVLREQVNPELRQCAAELHRHMTPEERILWQELRGNRLRVHFRRQQPLAPPFYMRTSQTPLLGSAKLRLVVDFYCHQARLVVEVDGSPHRRQQGYDELRDSYLGRYGIRVLRLRNALIRQNLHAAVCAIRDALHVLP